MTIETICDSCIKALMNEGYNKSTIFNYKGVIKGTKQSRQREVLCELRNIFRYLERKDLLSAIAGIHAPRIKRIIPILSDEEIQKIKSVIVDGRVTLRDAGTINSCFSRKDLEKERD